MIPYGELERALARWKARKDGGAAVPPPAPVAAAGVEGEEAPRKRFKSSLDWSMDQAIAHSETSGEPSPSDTSEIAVEATPPPVEVATEPQTGEIDVGDIEEEVPE